MRLTVDDLSCGYGEHRVVDELSLTVDSGEVMCLLGPNGVGKTTLFKTILGFLAPQGGRVLIDGRDARTLGRREQARLIAYVPQAHTPPFPFSVRDVVTMGRTARLGLFSSPGPADKALALESLERLGIDSLAERPYTEISGGERQMVLIARALTQQAQLLIMDEPTSSLDFGNQVRVLRQVRRLAGEGLCIVMTTHEPDHALWCDARVTLLEPHGPAQVGSAAEIITEAAMNRAYGVAVRIGSIAGPGGPPVEACVPLLTHSSVPDRSASNQLSARASQQRS
ncbi:iron complex transport system ATP-binding protein [Propionibacterium cyclohexanicum]|uniref:Iron complex transport system ATP-binding protein n=1 Tax=Propionibacterium cyclohexanicum TaxID=64702 RepID=A0A1H9PHH5_9ACTN|nr:ABC transporter ATP-binding protein [Propionibacterium cyclohexanicum]SER47309.1 iron complex transport system ATP-binding protein [Propionibacterium cyclohexanicum]